MSDIEDYPQLASTIDVLANQVTRKQQTIDEIVVFVADRNPELAREIETEILDY